MYLNIILILFCTIQAKGSAENKNCVNDSAILWRFLDAWNIVNIREKWQKVYPIEKFSKQCQFEFGEFLDGVTNGSVWAMKMIDASGNYGGGVFWGNEFSLGSNSLCQNLELSRLEIYKNNSIKSSMDPSYYKRSFENRIITEIDPLQIFSTPPFSVGFSVVQIVVSLQSFCQLSSVNEKVIYLGLCLPKSCNTSDIKTSLNLSSGKLTNISKIRILNNGYSIWKDTRFYILSTIFITVLVLMIMGTVFQLIFKHKKQSNFWLKFLNAFSIIGNLRIIFMLDVGEDTLAPIHGLKFISMMWIILIHTCLITFQVAENKTYRDRAENDVFYQTISNGTFSVDTFFTLSGVLVSYLFFRTIEKYSVKKLTGVGGKLGRFLLYISMLIYRLLRLSIPYLFIIILTGFLMEIKVNNAPLPMPSLDHLNCARYWWRNALFINTFYPVGEMCMMWSWYLANDTQFFILGIPLLLIALNQRLISLLIGIFILVTSWIITALISVQKEHIVDVRDPFANYDQLYDKPWIRVGPYLIGMIVGWLLYQRKCQFKLSKPINFSIWICALTAMIFVIYSPAYLPKQAIFGALYTSLSHSVWSLAVSWVLIACVTNNGGWINNILSWRYMYPASRLSYCVYLVHPLIIREVLLSSDSPFYISVEIMAILFFGFLFLSFIFGGLLSLAFEAPMIALLRLAHPMRRNQN